MKKNNKRVLIISGVLLLIIAVIVFITFSILKDENKITVAEKKWLTANASTRQNIKVVNNINVFGSKGTGVYYDFLTDFGKNYNLQVNPVAFNKEENQSGLNFGVKTTTDANDLVFFTDHFVLVGKKQNTIKSTNDLAGKKIGILSEYNTYVTTYLTNVTNLSFVKYEKTDDLLKALDADTDINYMLIPRNEFMDTILAKNYNILFHLDDAKIYYTLTLSENPAEKELSNIMKKYYNIWMNSDFNKSYNINNLKLFVESLNIAKKDQDTLTSKVYNYGFIQNSPYEVIIGGNYGGIVSSYLKQFIDFINVEFHFVKYKNISALNTAINKKEIDLYFNTLEYANEFKTIDSLINIDYSILSNKETSMTINSLKSLENAKVYVLENSSIFTYLKSLNYLNIETFKTYKDLFKVAKKDNIVIAIDTNTYNYYVKKELSDYSVRYNDKIDKTYNFKTNANETFSRVFTSFINSLSPNEMNNIGVYNHDMTIKSGTIFERIANYLLVIIIVAAISAFFLYHSSKRIKLSKKIKKDDKMRFIDQLTSLKNRNYLTENIENWNKNTIYPQACIVMDLNNVQEINDTLGYDQGDAQIKAAANILIKTQLDNTDIIRTDGNEFLIYLVGYQEKQVVSYIRKVFKELKNLPFDYGAALGYSMILDDLKTIEDSINEAVEDMRIKKEEAYEE